MILIKEKEFCDNNNINDIEKKIYMFIAMFLSIFNCILCCFKYHYKFEFKKI